MLQVDKFRGQTGYTKPTSEPQALPISTSPPASLTAKPTLETAETLPPSSEQNLDPIKEEYAVETEEEMERVAAESLASPEVGNQEDKKSDPNSDVDFQDCINDFHSLIKSISEDLCQNKDEKEPTSSGSVETDSNELMDDQPKGVKVRKSNKSTQVKRRKKMKTKREESKKNDEHIPNHLEADEKSRKRAVSIDEGIVTDPYDFDVENDKNPNISSSSFMTPGKRKRKGSREEWKLNEDSQETTAPSEKKRKRRG